jgi:hypothetical protein
MQIRSRRLRNRHQRIGGAPSLARPGERSSALADAGERRWSAEFMETGTLAIASDTCGRGATGHITQVERLS